MFNEATADLSLVKPPGSDDCTQLLRANALHTSRVTPSTALFSSARLISKMLYRWLFERNDLVVARLGSESPESIRLFGRKISQ